MRYATSRTEAGSTSRWLNCQSAAAEYAIAGDQSTGTAAAAGRPFEGYRNAGMRAAPKSVLGITTSVHCVAGVVDYVVKVIERLSSAQIPECRDGVVG